eukprot:TRINITY_DN5027_c0_g1_i1.p1 TRINITY_DN5027_c0_g1~~TRINITY_DN5027_c0_g1_i1.p1  ORF type:complete len:384 (-),score=132.86 TRINITY_DN5027_c0_g1_i1:189-1340(-)
MNIAHNGISKKQLNFVNFNQDYSCISIGTGDGYAVYNIHPKFLPVHSFKMEGIAICEMLFNSSLVAIVGNGSDPNFSARKLHIMNTKTQTSICELNFVTPILAVKLNKKRLIVVMETKIHIYDISTIKILHTIDTVLNPKGLVALSPSDDNCYLCYPGSNEKGEIVIFDALSLQTMNVLNAHQTPLAKMAINSTGTMIASASNKGTVIRVFSLVEGDYGGKQLVQLRRGSYPAVIQSIAFSVDSLFLAASSDTGTVHIFKLSHDANGNTNTNNQSNGNHQNSKSNNLPTGHRNSVSSYLSFEALNDMWEKVPSRSFATIKLNNQFSSLCAFGPNDQSVLIANSEGLLLQFSLDPKIGGELKLASENALVTSKPEEVSSQFINS